MKKRKKVISLFLIIIVLVANMILSFFNYKSFADGEYQFGSDDYYKKEYPNIADLLKLSYDTAKTLPFASVVYKYLNQYGQGVNVRLCLSQWY